MAQVAPGSLDPVTSLNLTSTYGSLLLGSFLCCALYGMTVIQIFLYFNKYERDLVWIKLFVLLTWAVCTAATICTLAGLWPPLISQWGLVEILGKTAPPILHRVWLTGVEVFLVHMFYIFRIYVVNDRKLFWPLLLIPLTMYQLIESAVYAHITLKSSSLSVLYGHTVKAIGYSGRAAIAFVDISIVVLMTRALLKKGVPKFKSSQKMIISLITITIHTGLWTAVFAIAVLALNASSDDLYFSIVELPLTPLYLNSLLANLNVRDYVRKAKPDVEYNSFPLGSPGHPALGSRSAGSGSASQIAQEFQIQTKTSRNVTALFDSESVTTDNCKPSVSF